MTMWSEHEGVHMQQLYARDQMWLPCTTSGHKIYTHNMHNTGNVDQASYINGVQQVWMLHTANPVAKAIQSCTRKYHEFVAVVLLRVWSTSNNAKGVKQVIMFWYSFVAMVILPHRTGNACTAAVWTSPQGMYKCTDELNFDSWKYRQVNQPCSWMQN